MMGVRYLLLVLLCVGLAHAASPLTAAQVPSFQIRFRLVAPADQKTTQFALSGDNHFVAKTQRDGWSDWLAFGSAEAERVLAQSPNLHAKSFPLVVKITVSGASAIASVDAEVKFGASDTPVNLHEELFGATFGVAVWRDVAGTPRA